MLPPESTRQATSNRNVLYCFRRRSSTKCLSVAGMIQWQNKSMPSTWPPRRIGELSRISIPKSNLKVCCCRQQICGKCDRATATSAVDLTPYDIYQGQHPHVKLTCSECWKVGSAIKNRGSIVSECKHAAWAHSQHSSERWTSLCQQSLYNLSHTLCMGKFAFMQQRAPKSRLWRSTMCCCWLCFATFNVSRLKANLAKNTALDDATNVMIDKFSKH